MRTVVAVVAGIILATTGSALAEGQGGSLGALIDRVTALETSDSNQDLLINDAKNEAFSTIRFSENGFDWEYVQRSDFDISLARCGAKKNEAREARCFRHIIHKLS